VVRTNSWARSHCVAILSRSPRGGSMIIDFDVSTSQLRFSGGPRGGPSSATGYWAIRPLVSYPYDPRGLPLDHVLEFGNWVTKRQGSMHLVFRWNTYQS